MALKSNWWKELVNNALAVETPQLKIMEHRINQHLKSDDMAMMKKAYSYYRNKTAIQNKKRELKNRTNSKIELGLFKKLVRQKVGYLLSKTPSITCEDENTQTYLNEEIFDRKTLKTIKDLGQEAIIKGIAYSMVYINEEGKLRLFKVPSEQIIPFWSDERRLYLDAFIRFYKIEVWEQGIPTEKTQVCYFDENGVTYYILDSAGFLELDDRYDGPQANYYYFDDKLNEAHGLNWDHPPLIAWRYNEDEESLLVQVESLIDNLSLQFSTSADLLADLPKFIYVLKDYGGQDLGEFLEMLEEYMAVSVGGDGGVDKLQANIDTLATENEITRTRKTLYEAAAGIDTQDENLGNASGKALQWRYVDLDLDMNDMEAEFHSAIEQFMWFVENFSQNNNIKLNLEGFEYVFNRDIITNESDAIIDAQNSIGILDEQTIRENHPWYSAKVEARLKKEKAKIPKRPEYEVFEEKVNEDGEEEKN